MRYQIIKPLDDDWEVLGQVLRTVQRETHTLLNKTVQLAWEWQGFSSGYKEKYGLYPIQQEVLPKKKGGNVGSIRHYAYDLLKDVYTVSDRRNLNQSIKRATDKWNSDVLDIRKGEKSIPSFKKDCPIDVVSQAYSLHKESECLVMRTGLMSTEYKKELGRSFGSFDLLIAGEYKAGVSQILSHKKKWFVNLTYSFEQVDSVLNPDRIMGVDLGIVYPVYLAFNDLFERYKIDGGEIENFRKQVERRRQQQNWQGKYCGDGRIGHGVHTRIKPTEVTEEKIANFRDSCNHKYSRFVVEIALKHGCGTIQMEDLSGYSEVKDDAFLKNWAYYDLKQKIEYKAKDAGIKVVKVNPRFTSQRCSKCGHIAKENRQERAFLCQACGFQAHADYNAARNIATKDIEDVIKQVL
ncbi:RNA-guided endonuclease TnpB family protein [Brevibacillus sp. SIMBA_040]|uniref:RNA-guided endonuclease TnpB family protein n=1 Tax=unclassified Brevibacillus TaxID=2684853 RepID=UPI00397BB182